ncbi:hypothetical protein [Candidatus Poriferisodalis sp.]|uniref:hypothetical protein n=2 Tax=Candidatus Poriferisodalis sp. TaxID=3101277 RepID=UPI003AF9B51B
MSRFVSTYGVGNMPHLPDENGDLWRRFGVSYQPRWLLIRADGTEEPGGGVPPDSIVQDALTPGAPG